MQTSFILRAMACACAGFALSGCGGSTGIGSSSAALSAAQDIPITTTSNFVLPTGSGTIYAGLSAVEGSSIVDVEGDGYAYQVGKNSEGNFVAVAGLVDGKSLPDTATSGMADYSGTYNLVFLNRDSATDATAVVSNYDGDMTFTADLSDGTFSGISKEFTDTDDGSKPVFYTKGDISSGELDGLVRFRQGTDINMRADATGVIGANKALGAFQGDDGTDAVSGGFNVLAD